MTQKIKKEVGCFWVSTVSWKDTHISDLGTHISDFECRDTVATQKHPTSFLIFCFPTSFIFCINTSSWKNTLSRYIYIYIVSLGVKPTSFFIFCFTWGRSWVFLSLDCVLKRHTISDLGIDLEIARIPTCLCKLFWGPINRVTWKALEWRNTCPILRFT